MILDSKLIDVAQLKVGATRRPAKRNENLYKLCICLPSQIERSLAPGKQFSANPLLAAKQRHSKLGLVFAVKQPELSCQRIGATFCQKSLR